MQLALDEVRRLTGPNLLSDYAGAIIDVFIENADQQKVIDCWQNHLNICQELIGWNERSFIRFYEGGASMSLSAPIDQLYSACDLIELAWDCCVAQMQNKQSPNIEDSIERLKLSILEERNPALISLIKKAAANGVRCLVDDDEVSFGTGTSAQTFPVSELPAIDTLNWSHFSDVPLALITGTNGKSTSVRLAAEIAKAEGLQAGVTSTDFIKVGDHIIDEGDYSGPGGARMLLRDKRTEIAFLEVARGGLLRRGLPVFAANAALVTNAASDHLGQYGINSVNEIAQVKLMVSKAIHSGSTLVLNADDKHLVLHAKDLDVPICWFSRDYKNPLIEQQIHAKQACVYEKEGNIYYYNGAQSQSPSLIASIVDIPMTVNGTALHNIENALGVVGLSKALNISDQAIKTGLKAFASDADDNPGRTNIYDVNGTTVIVDFAHNAHSMQAVIDMVNGMQSQRAYTATHVMFSHGGDRSNHDILAVTNAVHSLAPNTYVLTELSQYLRGREFNEISNIVEAHLLEKGVSKSAIVRAANPLAGAQAAFNKAGSNDLILLFTLSERENVQDLILSLVNTPKAD